MNSIKLRVKSSKKIIDSIDFNFFLASSYITWIVLGEQSKKLFCEAMEGSSSNNVENIFLPAHDPNELRNRQNELEKKEARIQELKKQIELTKLHLEEMKKKSGAKEKMEAFNQLVEAYNRMREEYNAWLAERSRDSNK
ncbi:hypothetical protein L3X38_024792 [Prunus dulcis]|uniref:Uncharacterized protein n=3 Tax=Prunus TaxID=3754 RepID=A0AAD4Z6U7_PRUDU|nr:hypothetical protein L3X38_024792 [Prunus dulcis]